MEQPVEEWISLRAFARRRGVRLAAVQKAIESGRVKAVRRNAKGRLKGIEFHQATRQWETQTDPVQAARSGQMIGGSVSDIESDNRAVEQKQLAGLISQRSEVQVLPAQPGEPGAAAPAAVAGAGTAGDGEEKNEASYLEARAKRERFAADTAEIEYLQAIGQLVPVAEMGKVSERRYRAIRDKLLNIPDRLAPVLAAERDQARIHVALTKELKQVLHELSDDARAEVAGGVAVGVAA